MYFPLVTGTFSSVAWLLEGSSECPRCVRSPINELSLAEPLIALGYMLRQRKTASYPTYRRIITKLDSNLIELSAFSEYATKHDQICTVCIGLASYSTGGLQH